MTEQIPDPAVKTIEARRNAKREIIQLMISLAIGKVVVLLSVFFCDPSINFFHMMNTRWDSIIFQNIATQGYTQVSQYAFSPVYPALIHGMDFITGHSWVSAFIITNIISFIFPLVLHKTFGFRTALLAILFPTYLVFTTIPYSDVIVLLFLALSLFFMVREKFIAASAMISLAIFGAFRQAWLLPAYGIEILKTKRLINVTFFILPYLIGVLILLWFELRTGNFLTYFSIEANTWGVNFATPIHQILWLLDNQIVNRIWEVLGIQIMPPYWLVRNLLFEVFYLVGTFLMLRTNHKHREFLFLYSLFAIIPLLCVIGTPAISIPRLLLPAFPAFLGYAAIMNKKWHYWTYAALCLVASAWVSISQAYSFFA
jgi:hypothetical protein